MASDLNRAEVETFHPFQYLDPTFYKLQDYFDCFLRGVSSGLILNAPLILLGVFSPNLLIQFLPCIVGISCLLGVVFAAVAHSFQVGFSEHVAMRGVSAYLTYEDVSLPVAQAYELCLASTMQLRSALIVRSSDDEWICARVKAVPDRTVVIRLESFGKRNTRISIECVNHWSPIRSKLVRQLFGRKFEQLMLRIDDGLNAALIEEVAAFVRNMPNWDHQYEGFKLLQVSKRS
jgi:hypothetical protein